MACQEAAKFISFNKFFPPLYRNNVKNAEEKKKNLENVKEKKKKKMYIFATYKHTRPIDRKLNYF